jgi:hypothetical protein
MLCWTAEWHGSRRILQPDLEVAEVEIIDAVLVATFPALKLAHNRWCNELVCVTSRETNLAAIQAKVATCLVVVTKARALVESAADSVEKIPLIQDKGFGAPAETESATISKKALADAEKQLAEAIQEFDTTSKSVAIATATLKTAQTSACSLQQAFQAQLANPDRNDIDAFGSQRRRDIAEMEKTQPQGSNNRMSMFGSSKGKTHFKTARGITERVYHGVSASSPLAESLLNKPQSHSDKVDYKGSRGPCIRCVELVHTLLL